MCIDMFYVFGGAPLLCVQLKKMRERCHIKYLGGCTMATSNTFIEIPAVILVDVLFCPICTCYSEKPEEFMMV